MNFKIKSLVAAVALAAVAGSASAAIESPISGVVASTTNTGGSELVFVVWDSVGKKSYTKDLGIQASDFNLSLTQSFGSISTAGDAAWNSYVPGVGSLTNSTWGVVALRRGDLFTDNENWGLFTVRDGKNHNSQTSGNLKTVNTAFSAFITDANTEGHVGVGNFSDYSAFGDGNSYWGTQEGSKLQAKLVSEFDNVIGTDGIFWKLEAAEDNAAQTISTPYGKFSYNVSGTTGALAYTTAAVPEPETYSMLAAGLMLLGAVARRRLGSSQ